MTARLPVPGQDNGTWGDVLNEFLRISHSASGTLNNNVVSTDHVQDGTITKSKLSSSVQLSLDNADAAVNGTLANAAVTTVKIADNAVTNSKLDIPTQTTLAAVASKYVKPAGGIPASDLTSGVQASITKADTALQSVVDNTVSTSKLQDGAVTNVKVTSIDASKITSGTLSSGRIPDMSATYAKITGSNTFSGIHDFTNATVSGLPAGPQGAPGLVWRGVYSGATTYAKNDAVQYNGASFITTTATIGVSPGTSGSPSAPWQLLAVGPQGPAGSGAAGVISPSDLAFKAWACDPALIAPGTRTTLVAGQMNGVLLNVPAEILTGVSFFVGVAGVALSNTFVGLIDATTGNRLAVSADLSTTFQTTGFKRVTFANPYTSSGGLVYIVFLVGAGTTMPQLTKLTNTDTAFVNARGPNAVTGRIRVGQITVASGLSSIPTTNDLSGSSAQATGMWVGVD